MQRKTFLLKIYPDRVNEVREALRAKAPELQEIAQGKGIRNFSIWGVSNLLCGYGEYETPEDPEHVVSMLEELEPMLEDKGELICPTGTMRLMYHDIGVVREDKSLIRHRVFVTRLKPGCAEEYKRRHDALIEARGDAVSEGPDSNFTIWYGGGYIFGYCEKVRSYDREMTEAEREATIAWETRQL